MRLWWLISFISLNLYSQCNEYFFSLDFGGEVNQGLDIVEYLNKNDVPHVIFVVGNNIKNTAAGKKLCETLNSSEEHRKKIKLGNHTVSHKGFVNTHTKTYIHSEIIGNEAWINSCRSDLFVKVFRYPKGQSTTLSEQVLKENNYAPNYANDTKHKITGPGNKNKTSYSVGWTVDTRDWVKEPNASNWAQIQYFAESGKLLPVSAASRIDFLRYLQDDSVEKPYGDSADKILKLLKNDSTGKYDVTKIPLYSSAHHNPRFHGPTAQQIADRVLKDKGIGGRCYPLLHFGGWNTMEAIKQIVPSLKAKGAKFKLLQDDDYSYAVVDPQVITQNELSSCPTVSTSGEQAPVHIVESDETLFGISQAYGISVDMLKYINQLSSNTIYEGQVLKLSLEYKEISYTNDYKSLWDFSQKNDISLDTIYQLNPKLKANPSDISFGDKVKVPL
jgi:LysM repeat protein